MSKKQLIGAELPVDRVGDALADVYLFLLRKAGERRRAVAATEPAVINNGTQIAAPRSAATEVTVQPGALRGADKRE
jgi:hypothetical protein